MLVRFLRTSRSGFTLIEMVISMAIFSMMSIMVMTVYFGITNTTTRMNAQRQLSESAREILERIGQDTANFGFSGSAPEFTNAYDPWKLADYVGSGAEILNLNNIRYVYGRQEGVSFVDCGGSTGTGKTDPRIHCGLYAVPYGSNGVGNYDLVDSFIPDETKKRVKIEDLRFYVSGTSTTSYKVMLSMTLSLMQRPGITAELARDTKLHIQTTFSERSWKQQQ